MLGIRAVAVAFFFAAVGGARADVLPAPPPQPLGQGESAAFQRCSGMPKIIEESAMLVPSITPAGGGAALIGSF